MENIWSSFNQKQKTTTLLQVLYEFLLYSQVIFKSMRLADDTFYRNSECRWVRNAVYLLEGNPEPLGAELLILLLGVAERWRHQSYWSDLIPQHHHHPELKKYRENHVSTILEVESGIYRYWGGWEMAPPVLLIRSNTATSSSSRAESGQRKSALLLVLVSRRTEQLWFEAVTFVRSSNGMSIQLDPKMSTSKWYLTLESNYKTPINMALTAQTPEQADTPATRKFILLFRHTHFRRLALTPGHPADNGSPRQPITQLVFAICENKA